MQLRERMEDRRAKQAFDNAIAVAKGEIGPDRQEPFGRFHSIKAANELPLRGLRRHCGRRRSGAGPSWPLISLPHGADRDKTQGHLPYLARRRLRRGYDP